MQASSQRSSGSSRGPAMYYGYCHRSKQYRMMDLPDYVSNTQEGMNNLVNNSAAAYQSMMDSYNSVGYQGANGSDTLEMYRRGGHRDCGCGGHKEHQNCGCHCECCVSDADVLMHARCGELRRIPLTFENDTRRDKPVTLELGKFLSQGGKDLGWAAQLTQTQFTLRPCDENTVSLLVAVRCKTDDTTPNNPNDPKTPSTNVPGTTNPATGASAEKPQLSLNRDAIGTLDLAGIEDRLGKVARCEVGYATIRAEGCLTRPIVVAISVLPENCDSFRNPCGCGCCR